MSVASVVFCQVEVCAKADHLSREVLLTVVCLSVIAKPYKGRTGCPETSVRFLLSLHQALKNLYIVHSPTNAFLLKIEKV